MKTIVITGATRGLGLAFATQLAQNPDIQLVLAVRDLKAGTAIAERLGANVETALLDMSSTASIQSFVENWSRPLFALINNAGLQIHGPTVFSPDDVEMTLAVNHLGVLQLTLGLLPWLEGGTVLGIGSGTHNPNDAGAKMFGFRGGRFSSIAALSQGKTDADTERQAGFDRYATSKLLSMATTVELARRHSQTRFITLDPGLMPGTGLVRSAPRIVQLAWKFAMPLLVPLLPGASTPERSAAAGCKILFDKLSVSGETYDYLVKPSADVWGKVGDPAFGRNVLDQSLSQLARDTDVSLSPFLAKVSCG